MPAQKIENFVEILKILSDESKGDEIVEIIKQENPDEYYKARRFSEKILERHPAMAMLVKQNETEKFRLALVKTKSTDLAIEEHQDIPVFLARAQGGLPNFGECFELDPSSKLMTYYAAVPTDESHSTGGYERAFNLTRRLLLEVTPPKKRRNILGILPIGATDSFFNYKRENKIFAVWKITSRYDPNSLETCYIHKFIGLENFRIFPFEADESREYLLLLLTTHDLEIWPEIERKCRETKWFDVTQPSGTRYFPISYSLLAKLNLLESLDVASVDSPAAEKALLRSEASMLEYSAGLTNGRIRGKSDAVKRISDEVQERMRTNFNVALDLKRFMFRGMISLDYASQEKYMIRKDDFVRE